MLEEKGETFFESGNGRVNWRYLPGSNEVIWFSQRDNWGQLYLYDLQTGKLKQPDHERRRQRHAAAARRRADAHASTSRASARKRAAIRTSATSIASAMDGKPAQLLTPEDADHDDRAVAVGQVLRRHLLEAGRAAGRRCCAIATGKLVAAAREGGHQPPARDGLEAADADHRQGARRRRPTSTA